MELDWQHWYEKTLFSSVFELSRCQKAIFRNFCRKVKKISKRLLLQISPKLTFCSKITTCVAIFGLFNKTQSSPNISQNVTNIADLIVTYFLWILLDNRSTLKYYKNLLLTHSTKSSFGPDFPYPSPPNITSSWKTSQNSFLFLFENYPLDPRKSLKFLMMKKQNLIQLERLIT